MSEQVELIPVKTRILTHKDDIVDVIQKYTKGNLGPDDVVSVAESVVAITQGRAVRPEDLKPGFWARLLSRLFPSEGSIASWHGMQALINEEGTMRVLIAVVCGSIGKIFGQNGVFYRMAGEQARLIDDVTGTMPPYDKYIVYGPHDPNGVAEAIRQATGCFGAAVADVNDLKRAAVLGVSKGLDPKVLEKMLLDNPFGNASQKTSIVIIRNYAKTVNSKA